MSEVSGKGKGGFRERFVQKFGKEREAYRGTYGLFFYRGIELTEEQASQIERIKMDARNAVNVYRKSREEGAKQESIHPSYPEALLIDYFARMMLEKNDSPKRGNASPDRGWAQHWTNNARMIPIFEKGLDTGENWAGGVCDLIRSIGFVVKLRLPKGMKFTPDDHPGVHSGYGHHGMQAKPSPSRIAETMSLDRVLHLNSWYIPEDENVSGIFRPLIDFQKLAIRDMCDLKQTTTLDDVATMFKKADEMSGLSQAVTLHREARDRVSK